MVTVTVIVVVTVTVTVTVTLTFTVTDTLTNTLTDNVTVVAAVTATVTASVSVTVTVSRAYRAGIVCSLVRHRRQRWHRVHQPRPAYGKREREEGAQQRQGPPIQALVYSHVRLQQQLRKSSSCCYCCCSQLLLGVFCKLLLLLFRLQFIISCFLLLFFTRVLPLTFLLVSCCWASATPLNIVETCTPPVRNEKKIMYRFTFVSLFLLLLLCFYESLFQLKFAGKLGYHIVDLFNTFQFQMLHVLLLLLSLLMLRIFIFVFLADNAFYQ